jgi:hypothetical protein
MSKGKIAVVIVGVLVGLVGLGFLAGGGGLLWANETQRDADGFFTTGEVELSTESYAITSEEIALGAEPGDWFPSGRLATVRLEVTGPEDAPVFVGIGPEDEVEAYLDGVARSEVSRIVDRGVTYRNIAGDSVPALPENQGFWAVSTAGPGAQTISWDLEQGRWTAVIMDAGAAQGVTVAASAGANTELLGAIAIGLLAVGVVLVIAAVALVITGVWRSGEPLPAATSDSAYGPYPVLLEGELDPNLSRWQWLVKWLLAIPHYIVLAFLWVAFVFLTIVAWFAILFTGRYPKSIFDFNVGVLRWSWRVSYYTYGALGTDQYPPFTLADADYPARFDVAYPAQLSRGLVLVKSWLLAIPHYIIVGLFTSGLIWYTTEIGESGNAVAEAGAGLIGILVFIAAVILLFTGRYPQGLFDLVVGLNRWVFRVAAYAALMRDEYPPFRLDTGGSEPGTTPPTSPSGSHDERATPAPPASASA